MQNEKSIFYAIFRGHFSFFTFFILSKQGLWLHRLVAETGAALILASYKGRINAPSILHVKSGGAALRYLRQIKSPEEIAGDDYALGFRIDGKIDWLYHCGKIHGMGECNLKKEFLINQAMLHAAPLPA